MDLELQNQLSSSVCQKSFEYSSTTLTTSTERCYSPISATFYLLFIIFSTIAIAILFAKFLTKKK